MSTKIKSFTRTNLSKVELALKSKLAEIEKEFGVAIKLGNMRFNENNFTSKLTAVVGVEGAKGAAAVAKAEWNKHCIFKNMMKSDFNKKTIINGEEFKITGIKPRSRNSILCTRVSDGKIYKVLPSMVKDGIVK
jgi:BMFP domain-containing protein YqiC